MRAKCKIHLNMCSLVFRRVDRLAKNDYFLRHVCLSVRMEHFDRHWKDFRKI